MELLKTNSTEAILGEEQGVVKSEETNEQIKIIENMKGASIGEDEKKKPKSKSQTNELQAFGYRAHFIKFLDRLTIHGVFDIYDVESWILKIFLLICFLTSASYCFYQIATSVLIFLQYDVLIKSQAYTSVPTEFPVVAFCNLVT